MSDATRPVEELEGVDVVFALLTQAVTGLSDRDTARGVPASGVERGHVLTHLPRNADGQRRMVEGVLVDEVWDQYPGGDAQRSADIEAGAHRPVTELLTDLDVSQRALVDAWDRIPDGAWDRLTRARAATRPVRAGVLSRWREVAVHLVDLDVGVGPTQLPRAYRVRDADWIAEYRTDW